MQQLMSKTHFLCAVIALFVCVLVQPLTVCASNAEAGKTGAPIQLQTDNLVTPMGLDDSTPQFAWQLSDTRRGARQTAYQLQVATSRELLVSGKPDAWDSGRIASDRSVGVRYQGSALVPTKRYYWRILAWDKDNKPYPTSEISWWETGLMGKDNWRAKWIGYQTWDEAAVRSANAAWVITADGQELAAIKQPEQHIAYRLPFTLDKPIRHAILYATGEDVASAWVNGAKVAAGAPLPPWKQMPWKKYQQSDVTANLRTGSNLLAIEITHYVVNPNGMATGDTPPMSATLVVQLEDSSVITFASNSNSDWKASIHPASDWTGASTEDASWKPVVAYVQAPGPMTEPIGNPWPTQSVKALRHDFEVHKPIASARLYSVALGAYQVFINGKRAGDEILAPGWTDYRERIKYQTYDVTASFTQGSNAIAALVAPGWYSTPCNGSSNPISTD
jgi:alpha-L-rhamnosidase